MRKLLLTALLGLATTARAQSAPGPAHNVPPLQPPPPGALPPDVSPESEIDAPVPQPTDRASIKDALTRALAQNPTAQSAAAELKRAAAIVEEVRSASLPTALFNAQLTHLDGTRSFSYPAVLGGGTVVATPQDTFTGNVTISLPLIAPQHWVQWAHALNDEKVATWTEADTRRTLSLNVAHAYLSVIAQRRVVELNERAKENDKAHYDYTHQRLSGGLGTPLDEIRARQQFESDESTLQSAYLSLERTQEALGVLLGENHPVDVTDQPWFEVPKGEGGASAWESEASAKNALAGKSVSRPDLAASLQRRDAADRVSRDDWADYLPGLAVSYAPAYTAPPSVFQPRWSYTALFTLSWAIYDGGLRYGQAKERAQLLVEADKALEASLRQADSDVRLGFEAVVRDDASLRKALAAAASAHQAFDVANLQYRAGATTNIDVIDAERRAHDADTNAAIAEDNARQTRLDLLASLGKFP